MLEAAAVDLVADDGVAGTSAPSLLHRPATERLARVDDGVLGELSSVKVALDAFLLAPVAARPIAEKTKE